MEQNWPRSFWNQRQELPCGHRLFNNFITIDRLHKATSKAVVGILKKLFTLFGIPTTIIPDGGPQFTASDFQIFTKKWGITHVRSSPHYPNANGKAKRESRISCHNHETPSTEMRKRWHLPIRSTFRTKKHPETRYRTKSNRNDV